MPYWICWKRGKYIADFDKDGNPVLTKNAKKAHRFKSFDAAMQFFNEGYTVSKEYF